VELWVLEEVWILEADYNHDASYIVCVFDHKPTKKEKDAVVAVSDYKEADGYSVTRYPVKGKKT
jgi:hypothetical protein